MKEHKQHLPNWIRILRTVSTPIEATSVAPVESHPPSAHNPVGDAESGDAADTVLDIAQEAPFIAPAAALLGKIIDFYKKVKSTNDKRDILAEHITNLAGDICATVLRMQETNHSDHIGRLKQDLETYATLSLQSHRSILSLNNGHSLIAKASKFIKDYDTRGKFARFAGLNQLGGEMDKFDEELKSFGARFGHASAEKLDEVHNMTSSTKNKLEEWLRNAPDMAEKQHDTQKLRKEDTGLWFLKGNKFIEWQDNAGVLWIVATVRYFQDSRCPI
ncbi:hypothetical protein B0H13DRAFT_1863635 [Mycena leptocephala]|nr:hypothetical protein B0H13DRAFT_1863635 [Mycena leptocephala]